MAVDRHWEPTPAHVRAVLGGLVLVVLAVVLRRPGALVLAAPLLTIGAWATLRRPASVPTIVEELDHGVIREGQATALRLTITDVGGGTEDVAAVLRTPDWAELDPPHGQVAGEVRDEHAELVVTVRATRWGRRSVGPTFVTGTSAWAGFHWVSDLGRAPRPLLALPEPAQFDATAPPVHAPGLVGLSRSPREGSGTEFAGIRPFQPGDRLRRIHWPRSLRSGTLHVTSTWADHDRHVVLIVDAHNDVGESEGIDGRASSLDIAVRAAGAIAEHYIGGGDRVELVVLGARGVQRVPVATGRRHLRRMLEVLAAIEPATQRYEDARVVRGLSDGSLVVMLSPLVSPYALTRAVAMADRGLRVLVVDCLPHDIARTADDTAESIAWRIRVLEREREIRKVQATGIAVVPWRGPGSLDAVLRDLQRHGGARLRAR